MCDNNLAFFEIEINLLQELLKIEERKLETQRYLEEANEQMHFRTQNTSGLETIARMDEIPE